MAKLGNFLLRGAQGQLGKQIVFKKYGNKTIVTKYPDMSNIKPSAAQKAKRSLFAKAVQYAQAINNNPIKKAAYKKKVKKGQSVYHYALKEFLKKQ